METVEKKKKEERDKIKGSKEAINSSRRRHNILSPETIHPDFVMGLSKAMKLRCVCVGYSPVILNLLALTTHMVLPGPP